MKTIWKYEIKAEDIQEIEMPVGSQILCVQTQREKPCIWILTDTETKDAETRKFFTIGTGHDFYQEQDNCKYIGSFQLHDGLLVFHLFELI